MADTQNDRISTLIASGLDPMTALDVVRVTDALMQARLSRVADAALSADAATRGLDAIASGDVPLDQVAQVHRNLVSAAQTLATLTDPVSGALLVAPSGGFDAL